MPELPEVETIVRGLEKKLGGAIISTVRELRDGMVEGDRERFFAALPGSQIREARRRGKLVLLSLVNPRAKTQDETLVFHLRMSGALLVREKDALPDAHTRVIFGLEDGRQLFFDDVRTFGICRLLNEKEKETWPFWKNLGPEPLEISQKDFDALFARAKRPVKSLLLDQTVIAGIGNIYADESLFRAAIHPLSPGCALTKPRLKKLREAVKEVLAEAIEQCGSSIRNYRDANGNAGAFQTRFRVYGRAGRPCARCGATLEGMRLNGRSTVFCPRCQPL